MGINNQAVTLKISRIGIDNQAVTLKTSRIGINNEAVTLETQVERQSVIKKTNLKILRVFKITRHVQS